MDFNDLDPNVQEKYRELTNTFNSPGWEVIRQHYEAQLELLESAIFHATNWDQYVAIRTQYNQVKEFVQMQDSVERSLEEELSPDVSLIGDDGEYQEDLDDLEV